MSELCSRILTRAGELGVFVLLVIDRIDKSCHVRLVIP